MESIKETPSNHHLEENYANLQTKQESVISTEVSYLHKSLKTSNEYPTDLNSEINIQEISPELRLTKENISLKLLPFCK